MQHNLNHKINSIFIHWIFTFFPAYMYVSHFLQTLNAYNCCFFFPNRKPAIKCNPYFHTHLNAPHVMFLKLFTLIRWFSQKRAYTNLYVSIAIPICIMLLDFNVYTIYTRKCIGISGSIRRECITHNDALFWWSTIKYIYEYWVHIVFSLSMVNRAKAWCISSALIQDIYNIVDICWAAYQWCMHI